MKDRIIVWIVLLLIAIGYIGISSTIKSKKTENEKAKQTKILVYNDVASDSVVKETIERDSKLSKKIDFCDDSDDAELIITKTNNELDENLEIKSSSYTPLVVCMKNSKNLEKYQENKLLTTASGEITNSPDDEIKIDFNKIINAVVKDKDWSEFGGSESDIRIFIPEDDTLEYEIFKKFLITTINGGTYPSEGEKLDDAESKADKFLDSSNCVETENVYSELSKINSLNSNDIYILFEADLMNSSTWTQGKLDIAIAYPKVTLVKHMYIQENSEENLNTEELPKELNYRTSDTSLADMEEKIYNISDDFSFIEVETNEVEITGIEIFVFFLLALAVMSGIAAAIHEFS